MEQWAPFVAPASAGHKICTLGKSNMADENDSRYPSSCCTNSLPPEKDLIRQEYKYYKRKKPPPDFSEVIDFNYPEKYGDKIKIVSLAKVVHSDHGLRCSNEWKVYELVSCPGFLFIVNPFSQKAQRYWTRRCIEDFTRKPNVSNLDAHMKVPDDESIWELDK